MMRTRTVVRSLSNVHSQAMSSIGGLCYVECGL